jgi:hypothetical protein
MSLLLNIKINNMTAFEYLLAILITSSIIVIVIVLDNIRIELKYRNTLLIEQNDILRRKLTQIKI